MAYREYGMWEIVEILKRSHWREPQRRIAEATRRSPKTIRRFVRKARKLGWKGSVRQMKPGRVEWRLR